MFTKGKSGNPKGRTKGSPNKTTTTLRRWFLQMIDDNREQLVSDLLSLSPAERLDRVFRLLPYLMPQVKADTDVEGACLTSSEIESKLAGKEGDNCDADKERIAQLFRITD